MLLDLEEGERETVKGPSTEAVDLRTLNPTPRTQFVSIRPAGWLPDNESEADTKGRLSRITAAQKHCYRKRPVYYAKRLFDRSSGF